MTHVSFTVKDTIKNIKLIYFAFILLRYHILFYLANGNQ